MVISKNYPRQQWFERVFEVWNRCKSLKSF